MSASPDIFLSYSREDAARAKHFADAFAAEGFNVWWDVALRSGEAYDEVTERALREARAVVVLWSPRSVVSRWVRAEATLADRARTLMPAMIEPCDRPIMFELVQTAELSHWQGDRADAAWRAFADHVREFTGKGGTATTKAEPAAAPRRALPTKPSIAVLPFINLSGDPEQEYFADGVVDDIISALARFNQLFVIARSSSFTYKGRRVDYRTVADELGVRFVLEGSIRKAGSRLRISGHLVDAQSGEHLWAEKFDGALEDVFDLQDRITEQVVGAIEPNIQRAEIVRARRKPVESLDAYDLYLQALPHLNSFTVAGNAPARKLLEQALAITPEYPQALAGLAWAHEQARWMGDAVHIENRDAKAVEYARRGLATRHDDAYVLAFCGFVLLLVGQDVSAAIAAKDRALLRNPNSPWANLTCSLIETRTGNAQAGLDLAERALRQNPLDPQRWLFLNALIEALIALERWEEATAAAEQMLADAPDWEPGLVQGIVSWANAGDIERAAGFSKRLRAIEPNLTIARYMKRYGPIAAPTDKLYRAGLALAGFPA